MAIEVIDVTDRENSRGLGFLGLVIFGPILYPVGYVAYFLWNYFNSKWHWHPLFCWIVALAAFVLILMVVLKFLDILPRWLCITFGAIYYGLFVLVLEVAGNLVRDEVWGCFFAVVAGVFGGFLFRAYRDGALERMGAAMGD